MDNVTHNPEIQAIHEKTYKKTAVFKIQNTIHKYKTICHFYTGEFCATDGLGSVTSGNCSAGYFCINASVTDQPTDGITGDICP